MADDGRLFEFLVLETFQAGLSWITILRKRENFRAAFAGFDPRLVAAFGPDKVEALMADAGIVRNRKKIEAAVRNAARFLEVAREFGSFSAYAWGFVGGSPIVTACSDIRQIPAKTPESEAMSRDMLRRGFAFVGPTACYAFMQSVGLVNDHVTGCFRHAALAAKELPPKQPGRKDQK